MARQTVRMCSTCAGSFKFDPNNHGNVPDTHEEMGEDCPTVYR